MQNASYRMMEASTLVSREASESRQSLTGSESLKVAPEKMMCGSEKETAAETSES
jgi:hypothetical protein